MSFHRISKEEISKVPTVSGAYMLCDGNRKQIYVGSARNLRHRLQSYYEADDFVAHPTKQPLRAVAVYFDFKVMPMSSARKLERGIKWKKMPEHNRK